MVQAKDILLFLSECRLCLRSRSLFTELGRLCKKALDENFRKKCLEALSVKNYGICRRIADQIYANFRTSREKDFKDNATMRFHRFDGTGYFQFRCTRKGSNTDGITVDESMQGSFTEYMRCAATNVDDMTKKHRIRINAVLSGGASKASKVFQEFDWIYHRPLPPEAEIQNGKILRTRVGASLDMVWF